MLHKQEAWQKISIRYFVLTIALAVLIASCSTKRDNSTNSSDKITIDEQTSYRIAYIAWREGWFEGERNLYVWDLSAGSEQKLATELLHLEAKFDWSPDGTQLVFQNETLNQSEVYTVDVANGDLEQLTNNQILDEEPDWSPCGDWIAIKGVGSEGFEVRLINLINHEYRPVISDPGFVAGSSLSSPLWSPDASKLAAVSWHSSDRPTWNIFNVSTGRKILEIEHDRGRIDARSYMATWSPDGKTFAYTHNQDGTFDLYVQDVDNGETSTSRKLTDLTCDVANPVWHPSKAIILFTCLTPDNSETVRGQLYTVNVETLEIQRLTDEAYNLFGDWSPDGGRIVFVAVRDGLHFLAIMDADGSNSIIFEETQSAKIWMPKWAPDSKMPCDQTSLAPIPSPSGPAVVILEPDVSEQASLESMAAARDILQARLDYLLDKEVQVLVEANTLRVELTSVDDVTPTIQLASQIGEMVFFDSMIPLERGASVPKDVKTIITNENISQAQIIREDDWQILVSLTAAGTKKIAEFTEANVGHYLVIAYDGYVVVSPQILAPTPGGQAIIGGDLDRAFAEIVTAQLNGGRLPFKFKVVEIIK